MFTLPRCARRKRVSTFGYRAGPRAQRNPRGGAAVADPVSAAAPAATTLRPSPLHAADATAQPLVESSSQTNVESVRTTAAPLAPTRARQINAPSGDNATAAAPSHSTVWMLSIVGAGAREEALEGPREKQRRRDLAIRKESMPGREANGANLLLSRLAPNNL